MALLAGEAKAKLDDNLLPGLELLQQDDKVFIEFTRRCSPTGGQVRASSNDMPSSARRLAFSEIVGRVADWICRIVPAEPFERGFRPGCQAVPDRLLLRASCWR